MLAAETATVPLTDWLDHAACRTADPELFYAFGAPDAALQVCAGCGVRADCLAYALANDEQDGVWGGVDFDARRLARAGRRCPICDTPIPDEAPVYRIYCDPACRTAARRVARAAKKEEK